MEHDCNERNRLLRIEKLLDGNGRPGLVQQVIENSEKIKNMETDLNSLAVSFSALAKSQLEIDITEKIRLSNEKFKLELSEKWMQAWTRISIIFGISIPLTVLILSLI
jgi:hypothetical protein